MNVEGRITDLQGLLSDLERHRGVLLQETPPRERLVSQLAGLSGLERGLNAALHSVERQRQDTDINPCYPRPPA